MSGVAALIDPLAGAIVVGGSVLATVMKCGPHASRTTLAEILRLARPGFRLAHIRKALTPMIKDVERNGLIRAHMAETGDAALDEGQRAMMRQRSFSAFLEQQHLHREYRVNTRFRAVDTLDSAVELAPVLGLAGTLLALSRLNAATLTSPPEMLAAISVAILSTLYGLIAAHFVFSPLARAIERRGKQEEDARSALNEWLADHIPRNAPAPPQGNSLAASRERLAQAFMVEEDEPDPPSMSRDVV